MPRVTLKVHGTYESITRPVALGVSRDVMAATGIDERKTESVLLGEFSRREQLGSKMGESQDVSFGSNSRTTMTVEDNIKYDSILNTHVRSKEHPPILADKRLGIGVFPVYVDSELTITFRYSAANKEEALKWRDDYAIKRAEDRTVLYHELLYYIPMQDGIFELLYHLWELREKISGYGDTFEEYLKEIQQRELTTLTRVDGDISTASIAVPEKQIQVTGWFDFTEPPKEEKQDGSTVWNIEWSYKCLYKRCTHFYITYPIAIHQSHIGRKYFDDRKYYSYEDMGKNQGIRIISDNKIRANQTSEYIAESDGLRFPHWDDWIPKLGQDSNIRKTRPMLTWLVGLDPKNPKKIFDFTTMPELRLGLEIDTFMRKFHSKVTNRRKSIIYVRVYKNDIPLSDDSIYMDENLVLWSRNGLDLRDLFHVRLSIVISPSLLDKEAIDDLRRNPDVWYVIGKTLDNGLDDKTFLDNLVSGKVLKSKYIEQELHEIESKRNIQDMTSMGDYHNPKDNMGAWSRRSTIKTVQTMLIVSKRNEGDK